jgi:F0F1-type ATP synthase membrane subunit b/b'
MDPAVSKIQKHVDQLKAKHTKLVDENAKLKAQLAQAKQLNSRIRRIAKPTKPASGEDEHPAPETQAVEA